MNKTDIKIRLAKTDDIPELLKIYSYYVEKTAITFEYTTPSQEEFENRMSHILKKYPYLVAEIDGQIVGYSYASAFHERAAYEWAAEATVYVHKDCKKMGIGRKMYEVLEQILKRQNILNMEACIAYPSETEDEYLTFDSVKFHEKMGYRMVGEFQKCGYKFEKWYGMVWMEKHIGEHRIPTSPVIPFGNIVKDVEGVWLNCNRL